MMDGLAQDGYHNEGLQQHWGKPVVRAGQHSAVIFELLCGALHCATTASTPVTLVVSRGTSNMEFRIQEAPAAQSSSEVASGLSDAVAAASLAGCDACRQCCVQDQRHQALYTRGRAEATSRPQASAAIGSVLAMLRTGKLAMYCTHDGLHSTSYFGLSHVQEWRFGSSACPKQGANPACERGMQRQPCKWGG